MALLSILLAAGALAALPSPATAAGWTPPPEPKLVAVAATPCPATAAPGEATCLAEALPASDAAAEAAGAHDAAVPGGASSAGGAGGAVAAPQTLPSKTGSYSPADLASLYRIPAALTPHTTIGIVDVGRDPNTQAQMSHFRSWFHLPACTTDNRCFREVAQDGSGHLPGTDTNWVTEIAIDVQAVSAVCPTCHILLVDAAGAGIADLAQATLTATRLGASYVSLSYGSAESAATTMLRDVYYSNPNVTYVAAAGDSGYSGDALFPASAPNVVAAGGTSVQLVNGTWRQAAWAGSGSGCSSTQALPAAQRLDSLGAVCSGRRAVSDLSALADPDTGMLFYRGGRWWNGGGTSLAAPILASLYALAGNHTAPLSVYAASSGLVDVTSGSTGVCRPVELCSARSGWDGPTGLGTPAGLTALAAGAQLPSYTGASAATLSARAGYPTRLVYRLSDRASGVAVPAAAVRLERRRPGGSFRPVRRAATANDGSVVFTDRPTSTTTYRVVFAGDVTHQATNSTAVTVTLVPRVKLHRRHGRLRATVRTPWGAALRSTTLKLQLRHGHHWRTVRRLRVNRRGAATTAVRQGRTYRIRYGGGGWQRGHTHPVKAR